MKIPFVDLKIQYASMKEEVRKAIDDILENTAFVQGPAVAAFETEFAKYLGVKHFACVDTGTAALYLALRALGIREDDEVITVPNTFFATAEAISLVGAKPVFVDADPDTLLMDTAKIIPAITPKTKAIIPVHLYGQCADMDEIMRIAKERGLFVIEDACQAHGAEYKGKKAGSMGDMGCFSFYPGKNLGTYGEGGGISANNDLFIKNIRMMRDHGSPEKYIHDVVGGNFRMSGIEGAVLGAKLKYLDRWTEARRHVAAKYRELLFGLPVRIPREQFYNKHNYHLFVIATERRDELLKFLAANDIGAGIHYPVPIHLQKAYAGCGWRQGDFPVSEKSAKEILSLPMYPELNNVQILYVAEKIKEFFKK
jgi:dTDP-4-amino-4,6-dideoxygalactose transaminase